MFWKLFYNVLVIPLLWVGFHFIGFFKKKAAQAWSGRKNLFDRLQKEVARLDAHSKRIWFHSSSMGEFEQAKPIIAELKNRYPSIQIIVTFFSPSGYEHSKTYKLADIITYIPFDSYSNARKIVDLIKPSAAIIVRYDVWPNHLWALQRAGVPTFIANATLQVKISKRFPIVKQFHRKVFESLDYILTVSSDDKHSFETFHLSHPTIEIIGDTRYDQVWQRSADSKNRRLIDQKILENKKVLIIGSSWKEDEENLFPALSRLFTEFHEFLVILVPHEPTIENLERIENELNGNLSCIRFSNLNQYSNEKIILIDSVGILTTLYRYAQIAYVGGSFKSGVHNVLEPSVYGIPILLGPMYTNSQEAIKLIELKAAYVGCNANDLYSHLRKMLENETLRIETGSKAYELVLQNIGATKRFISYIEKVL